MRGKKGGLDPTALAGMFITLLMLWALSEPILTVVDGIASTFGGTAGKIVLMIPFIMLIAVLATLWDYQQTP